MEGQQPQTSNGIGDDENDADVNVDELYDDKHLVVNSCFYCFYLLCRVDRVMLSILISAAIIGAGRMYEFW